MEEYIIKQALRLATDKLIFAEFARRRSRKGGGRPRKLRRCPECGKEFSATEMRAHIPRCEGPAEIHTFAESQTSVSETIVSAAGEARAVAVATSQSIQLVPQIKHAPVPSSKLEVVVIHIYDSEKREAWCHIRINDAVEWEQHQNGVAGKQQIANSKAMLMKRAQNEIKKRGYQQCGLIEIEDGKLVAEREVKLE